MLNKSGYSTKLYTSPNPNTLILKTHTHKQVMYYILYNICIDCGIRNANILSDLTAASVLKILIIKSWRIHTYPIVFVIVMQWGITTSVYQFSKGRLTIYHYTRRLQLWGFFCISMQYVAMIYSTSRFWVNTINVNILEIHYSYVWIISNVDKRTTVQIRWYFIILTMVYLLRAYVKSQLT